MVDISYPQLRDDWSLDVVNILAFLGEHNILACSQQICMSWTCFLPRLIPAPQGLLAQRPKKLASEEDTPVTGTQSGVGRPASRLNRPALQYFGRMCHTDGSELPTFTTRVLKINWDPKNEDGSLKQSPLRPRLFSPMNLIAIFSCALSFGLAAWAFVLGDAVALTGILIMSFTTPLLCVGMRWRPQSHVPIHRGTGDESVPLVVIKSSNECLTVVECSKYVADLLYFHPEHIDYVVKSPPGRGLSGTVGGITLVGSIVLFGNAVWTMKTALAVTYTILNLLYWVAAILPVRLSWHIDLIINQTQVTEHAEFIHCLWTTIYTMKKIDWAREYVPKTNLWDLWLKEAQRMAESQPGPRNSDAHDVLIFFYEREKVLKRQQEDDQ